MATVEWVQMSHPQIKDAPPATATRDAFDEVWKEKGWVVIASADTDGETTPIFVPVVNTIPVTRTVTPEKGA